MLIINRRNPVFFTSALLLLSIILTMTIIRNCDGSMAACNGSTMADCSQVIEDEEQEFLMDTEEHMRTMEAAKGPSIAYIALQPGNPSCRVKGCAGDKKRYLHREL
ncbi:unnamed protein product [Lactuca virosa]|uniref:Uncharacterized protein n=1 Tax=Lactuca virosa TaxID=75947 RepID=A0AAU9LY91_9ASTR|nr:unnamed protein product [Lactuca virosa]